MDGETIKGETITLRKATYTKLLAALVIVAIAFSFTGGYVVGNSSVNGIPTTGNVVAQPTPAAPQQPTQPDAIQVSADDDPVEGQANAKVTIIEFSDFQCPFCERFYTQTLQSIRKDYVDTGKVKVVFRDFPLGFHPNAQKAAEASECADEQGKFWQMHDKLFETQSAWSNLDATAAAAKFSEYAVAAGASKAQFESCLSSGKYASEVQKDISDGSSYGVSGTPSFFVNGVKLVGAQPYSAFKTAIDAALAK
ncbi:MAG TPA: DsbA family protein [archaeon]|nr:DsbA family protein [archaeon]